MHFICHAGPMERDFARLGVSGAAEFLAFTRSCAPASLRLTANERFFSETEDESRGGRRDDAGRIADLQAAIDDPNCAAIVAARGGAYLTRILPYIDFSSLARRRRPLTVFGFSEITTLVNLVATYRGGRGLYWLCPNFLAWKIKPLAAAQAAIGAFWRRVAELLLGPVALDSQDQQLNRTELGIGDSLNLASRAGRRRSYTDDAVPIHDLSGAIALGRVRPHTAPIIGGCLSVIAAVAGTPLFRRVRPDGAWLAIEDIHEAPYRIDRYLATLKLLGWFERLAGVLVGDFHAEGMPDQRAAVVELLRFHLPKRSPPVVITRDFGHVWPIVPVPIGVPLKIAPGKGAVRFGTARAGVERRR
ncbi:MAG: LD-carboxypeptidase [Phycisphaerales bacterium]|nr:LD-carboxypeptidase [Phycisphaerales bacterium]